MSIEPRNFLATAKRLAQTNDEADLRSAAKQALPPTMQLKDASLNASSSHEAVIDAVERWSNQIAPGRTEAKKMARKLPNLKRIRVQADYKLQQDFSDIDAKRALAEAMSVINSANIAASRSPQ
ncbi:MAG: hypothetical protein HYZ45_12805 [Burkholderiales bacterium]|nr:hypothetical protein [Burkholderiales bacterium]